MAKMKKNRRYLNGLKGRIQNSLSGFLRACIEAMLVLFQVVILLVLPFFLRQYSSLFYLAIEVCGVATILALTNDTRSMTYKYAWLCITVVLPISGNIMFALWGKIGKRNKLNQKIKEKIKEVDTNLVRREEVEAEFRKKHPVSTSMTRKAIKSTV